MASTEHDAQVEALAQTLAQTARLFGSARAVEQVFGEYLDAVDDIITPDGQAEQVINMLKQLCFAAENRGYTVTLQQDYDPQWSAVMFRRHREVPKAEPPQTEPLFQ